MADWSRDKVDASNLNNGQEYTLDSDVSLEQLNAVVNNSLYAGDFVEELTNIDTTKINNVGEANVRVESSPNATPTKPYKRLVFENLKGEPGKDGTIGKDGKSAYEYAQEGGYTGTEQEFASELGDIATKEYVEQTKPTVSDATILITQGGNVKGSFTLNQSTGVHIDLDEGGGEAPTVTVDSALSETSTNPVQNKVIAEAIAGTMPISGGEFTGDTIFSVGGTKVWISFTDENGAPTTIPHLHWIEE